MGTAMRFFVALAGLLLTLIGLRLTISILGEVAASPWDIDMPGGPLIPVIMALLAGGAPLALGIKLLRTAARAGVQPAEVTSAAPAAALPVEMITPPVEVSLPEEVPQPAREALASTAPAQLASVARRPWLAVVGLCLVLIGLFIGAAGAAISMGYGQPEGSAPPGIVTFLILGSMPLAAGLWLAHRSDPGIGQRFVSDLGAHAVDLRRPSSIAASLRTSMGLAFALALVSIPLMLIFRVAALLVAFVALTAYSIADPMANTGRRSWSMGAGISAATWMALFAVLGATAAAMQPLGDDAMIFLFPMMMYGGGLAVSGIVRLARRRPASPPVG